VVPNSCWNWLPAKRTSLVLGLEGDGGERDVANGANAGVDGLSIDVIEM
jgi:hypothetical protein